MLIYGACTSEQVCENLLNYDVEIARSIVRSQYEQIINCAAAEAVVVDLAYVISSGGLRSFVNFKKAIQA